MNENEQMVFARAPLRILDNDQIDSIIVSLGYKILPNIIGTVLVNSDKNLKFLVHIIIAIYVLLEMIIYSRN